MRKVSEYRQHADECQRMARRMNDPEQKKQLLEMANTWITLATQLAKQHANNDAALIPAGDSSDAVDERR